MRRMAEEQEEYLPEPPQHLCQDLPEDPPNYPPSHPVPLQSPAPAPGGGTECPVAQPLSSVSGMEGSVCRPSRDSRKLDCIICFCSFNLTDRLPRRLYCGHTFCQACLRRLDTILNDQMWIPCPQCRQNTPLPRGGAGALDLDLAAFLGVKAELEPSPPRSSPRLGGLAGMDGGFPQDDKPWLGKQGVIEQPPGSTWAHGGLAEPRFHRYSPCCRPGCWLCLMFCCPGCC